MIKKHLPIVALCAMTWCAMGLHGADVREGLVSYWPLNALGLDYTTPDVVLGNDMIGSPGILAEDFVNDPVRGNVFSAASQFQSYLYFLTPPGEDTGLPVSMSPSWTVSVWVNATYPFGDPLENDRRVYSDSSSTNNDPLVNIGTHNTGADGTVDIFVRNGGTQVNHAHSTAIAYDGTWHHLAAVYSEGTLSLYIDGVPDITMDYIPGTIPSDVTSVGAVLRQWDGMQFNNVGALFTGLIDDLAVWERALTVEEINTIMTSGIPLPVPKFAPVITTEPVGADILFGDPYTLSVSVAGTRPFTFQWKKDGVDLPGETSRTLAFESTTPGNSGTYSVTISNGAGTTTSAEAVLNVSDWPDPDLPSGMLCYWPLDSVQGNKTPDLRSWYDMELVNLTEADLVPGRWGQCLQFDSARQTLLQRLSQPGDELPIYPWPSFTISLWVNGGVQTDLRVFSEGSLQTSSPLFNIGTHNTGADGTVDTFIRTDSGTTANHQHTAGVAFDNTWHHIVYVQRTVDADLSAVIYIDGVADPNPPAPIRPLSVNTTTIGGIRRGTPSHWWTGLIDDVALWNRALSPDEVSQLYSSGTPIPEPRPRPLNINSFTSDFPAVKAGETAILSWDVTTDVTVEITPGVGDVTGQTVAGAGSVEVTVGSTTTYTITLRDEDNSVSAQTTVAAIGGIGDNWSLLDNFEQYPVGPLGDTDWWLDLRASGQVVDANGNKMLSMPEAIDLGDAAAVLPLGRLALKEGESRTLFFRVLTPANVNVLLRQYAGLTDKNLRWHGDADESGPKIIVAADGAGGPMQLGTRQGQGSTADEWYPGLSASVDTLYNVWIDIQNRSIAEGDLFSIYIQEDGDAQRITLFENYVANRSPTGSVELGPTLPDLNKLFVSGSEAATLRFDDFYISNSGFNSAVPRAAVVEEIRVDLSVNGDQLIITWPTGVLESTPTIGGTFERVEGATSPFTATPTDQQRFYRVRN
jgi:hypothetical protein